MAEPAEPDEPAPRINNVYYLDVNPTFSFAESVVQQIIENGSFVLFCEGEVQLPDFQGNNSDAGAERGWNRLNDFSRTFGSVLRDMVLEATGRGHKVDPKFGDKAKGRNRENYQKLCFYPEPYTWLNYTRLMQESLSFKSNPRAQELVANYDRMNPHFYIEDFINKFQQNNGNMKRMAFDHRVYVIHYRGREREPEYIHQIDTRANISLKRGRWGKFEGSNLEGNRTRIEVNVKTYKKTKKVEGNESYKQLCTFNNAFINHKDEKKENKKYIAVEHEG